MSQQVLNRLRDYISSSSFRSTVQTTFPPASSELVTTSEKELGFRLNPFLREVYLTVANGGFGPAYGLIGLPGGATDDNGKSIVENFKDMTEYFSDLWPSQLVPVCHYGCGILGCIDCSGTRGAITTWHPGLPPDDINRWWKENFVQETESVVEWFSNWLDTIETNDSP